MPCRTYLNAKLSRDESQVLESGKSKEEMEAEFAYGPLEEVHAAVRGELELIKTLGKDFFKGE